MKQPINYKDLPKEVQKGFRHHVSYIDKFEFWFDKDKPDLFYCRYANELYVYGPVPDSWLHIWTHIAS